MIFNLKFLVLLLVLFIVLYFIGFMINDYIEDFKERKALEEARKREIRWRNKQAILYLREHREKLSTEVDDIMSQSRENKRINREQKRAKRKKKNQKNNKKSCAIYTL